LTAETATALAARLACSPVTLNLTARIPRPSQTTPAKHGGGMSRSWIFRYERAGKLRSMGLGSLIAIDLWWRLEDAAHGRDL